MIRVILSHYIKTNHNWQRISVLWLFFICFVLSSNAQSTANKVPLISIISDIESRFQYTFTYADDTIENVFVLPLQDDLSFEQILELLEQQTDVTFSKLANNFVVINKKHTSFLICGILKDRYTKHYLEGATIQGKNASAISGAEGEFELEADSKSETIIIGHLGYRTMYQLAGSFQNDDCSIIYMDSKTETLAAVLLSNYITKGIGKNDDGSFLINYENFGILPGLIETDVLQTVQALPGIQSADETVSNINIRGGTHDQNLILWDGIKMYQSGHFFGLISAINPFMTKKATLTKNGTGAEYTDGVSGTIIMNTDTAINDSIKASVGINMINADVFADVPIGKKSSIQIAARKSIKDIAETPTYKEYSNRVSQDSEIELAQQQILDADIGFDFYDINLRWNYDISNNDQLRVNFLSINNELMFTESALIDDIQQSRESSLKQNSLGAGIWYQRNWSEKLISVVQLYETDYTLKSINANLEEGQRFLQENKVSETSLKLKTLFTVNQNISLQNGYQFIETGITNLNDIDNPLQVREEVRVIRTHGLFSQINYKSKQNTEIVNFGLRYTYNDKFKSHSIEPRLSYNQQIREDLTIELLGELKHQNTSQIINLQNDFLGVEKRRWVLSNNQDIPVVKGGQISLGLQYSPKGWLITAEGYYKKVNDITARSQGFRTKYEFEQGIGDYRVSGIDFLINKRCTNISTWLSYSYANNDYTFNEFEDAEFPNNIDITHAVTIGGSYILNNVKISAGLNWNSGLPTTKPLAAQPANSNSIIYEAANSKGLREYLRLDISAMYDFNISKKVKAQTGVSIWNLTNRQNVINNYYRLDQENVPIEFTESSLAITPNATFRVSF